MDPEAGAGLALAAPAKLNLSLAVLGRRSDEYHELAGTMVLLDYEDEVAIAPGGDGMLVVAPEGRIPAIAAADNLARRGLATGLGHDPTDLDVVLVKRIPVAAGMGGGSSDAAAGWRLARRFAGRGQHLDAPARAALTALGADVPFFAAAAPAAYVTGVGERVEPLRPRPCTVLVAVPPFPLSTAAVFAELKPSDWSRAEPPREVEAGRNDLLAPALRLRPELAEVMTTLRRAGGDPHLTGSGPACFTLIDDQERAAAARAVVQRSGLRAIVARLRDRAPEIEELGALRRPWEEEEQ